MTDHHLAVLVLSCDKYEDLWAPFLQQFNKYFPVKDHVVYFGTNKIPCIKPGVKPVLSFDDLDWSTSLKKILSQISEPKVFIILEDLFLASPVDIERFNFASSFLKKSNALHIKYWANPIPDVLHGNSDLGIYHKGAPYRATVCGFWDRKYLMGLLLEGENPWNFEILGSYRTSYLEGFYGLKQPLCRFHNMVEKGCWIPSSVIGLELERRPMLNWRGGFMSRAKMIYFDLMIQIPWIWRVQLMNKMRQLFISY
jgi:hypothetical protein